MNEESALQIINDLANIAQKSGVLTIDDAVNVKQMLVFVSQKLVIKEEEEKPAE
jgi:hypothetical protein